MISVSLAGQKDVESTIDRLNAIAGDLDHERTVATNFLTGKIDDNFVDAESLFEPLADSTKKTRQRRVARGEALVANVDTPLRAFHDSIREAATATVEGVVGSAFAAGDDFDVIGIDPEGSKYMKRALLGDDKKPERNALDLPESDLEEAQRLMEQSLLQRLNGVI